jgi:uncharacterized protein YciI
MTLTQNEMNLFIVDIEHIAPLDQIDPHIPEHARFLQKHFDSGKFVVSGPKVPRTGGVILAEGKSREEIETLLKEDVFLREGLSRYTVTEMVPRMRRMGGSN